MKRTIKWLSAALLASLVLAGALFANVWYFKPVTIDAFYGRVFAKFALQKPELLSQMRILPAWLDFHSHRLDDASPAQERREAEAVRAELATLHRYDRAELDREGRLSYDTLDYFLRLQRDGEPYRLHTFPINQLAGVQRELPSFMAQVHQVTSEREGDDYVARLDAFPRKFDQLLEGLQLRESGGLVPPRFVVEKVIVQMREFVARAPRENVLFESLQTKLDKLPAGALDGEARERLLARAETAIRERVYPAYRRLTEHFIRIASRAQADDGAWNLPEGDAYYAWCVRAHTTTELTPQQVHDLGLSEVARIDTEMDRILGLQGLGEGSVGVRLQRLSSDPAQLFPNTAEGRQAMLARYQEILDEINLGLGQVFDIRPRQGVEVRAVPAFAQAGAAAAYYTPGSLDGSRPGVFYANLRDTADTPKFEMRNTAYHEGIPGHHFQIAIAQQLEGVPFFRKIIPFTAYSEGWALYAEQLAHELGFERDPLDNLGRLRWDLLRAVRLVVDTGIHYKHWTREQAIAYMKDKTGKEEAFVAAEIERYFVQPGQALAYKVGMLKILELREKAKRALGTKFDLAQFHNEVLIHGALPLVVLERVIDDWIERRQAG